MFDRLQQFVFISLGFSSGFQISSLFLRLVYAYDASTSGSHAFLSRVLVLMFVFCVVRVNQPLIIPLCTY